MKKRILIVFLILICILSGCQSTSADNSDTLITYPGTRWNMTPSELLSALHISEADFTVHVDNPRTDDNPVGEYQISIHDQVYGYAAEVGFTFRTYTDDAEPGLAEVFVLYDTGVDMTAVQQAVITELGPIAGSHDSFPYVYWDSTALMSEYMSEEYMEQLKESYTGNTKLPNSEELLQNILNAPAVRVFWVNEPEINLPIPPVSAGTNVLYFNGSVTEMLQRFPNP